MSADAETVRSCAEYLTILAAELRSVGDVPLVHMTEEGVSPAPITLADELWLIALRLDGEVAMRAAKASTERNR